MRTPPASEKAAHPEPPLWSIGLAVAVILGAPLVLYSLAPTGPLREGDTVFSDGEQRVRLSSPSRDSQLQPGDTCLLDPGNPLIIVHGSNDEAAGSFVAQVQGRPAIEWPFCPPYAEVQVTLNQVFQKPAVFSGVKELLARLLGR